MPNYRSATVTALTAERRGLQRMTVTMDDGSEARAYALTELTGPCAPGDRVVCNTTAVDRSLGSGGWHVVHWNLANESLDLPGPDHVMKMRYTSLQTDVGTSELLYPEAADRRLDHTPVVVCTLHSQMALVALGFAHESGGRLAYVMTDGAALPLAMSELAHELVDRDLLVGTVTAGHSFGGDLEAVTPASALGLAAHVLEADAIVLAMGPGVVGTGTAMGTTAIEAAGLLDLVQARGGKPVLCVRTGDADSRERHQGVSHHVQSVMELTSTTPAVALMAGFEGDEHLGQCESHDVGDLPDSTGLMTQYGVSVSTMGRGPTEEPTFFESSVAAGILAARLGP